jgi:hypothetical protein
MSTNDYFLDTQNIINQEFFYTVKELLTCIICKGVILDPKQCQTCENTFCNMCISKWMLKSKTCPYKCSTLAIKNCTRAIRNLLDKLIIKCPFDCNNEIQFNYDTLLKHLKTCNRAKCKCPTCGTLVSEELLDSYQGVRLKEEIKLLQEANKKLQADKTELSDKLKLLNKMGSVGANSTAESELGLKDKCEHFKGNYIPLFACCSKAYPCYICHDKESNHVYEFSNRVICLNCNNIYTGLQCSQCNTFQVYRKK